jgi:carboxyl-terminal processing protease
VEHQSFWPETVLGVARQSDNSWDFLADRQQRIAHVRIAALSEGTSEELQRIVASLQQGGIRGLLLDLRWCPGGLLSESINVADLFLGDCTVATTLSRDGARKEYRSKLEHSFLGFPLLVLVNGETSGGAELIAAALQDNRRARVAGQRTRGKGSIQTVIALPVSHAGLKLTNGLVYRPNGKCLDRPSDGKPSDAWGARPDRGLESRVSPQLSGQLKEWWLLQTLRPGTSSEALPLDDASLDPQAQEALAALRKVLK